MTDNQQKSVLDRAVEMSVNAYHGLVRNKDGTPYLLHPMEVAVIASTLTKDEEVLAAAMLHDAVEDAGISLREIREICGKRVAELVESETEEKYPDKPAAETWKIRKQESLDRLRDCNSIEIKILWLADKLSNVRSFYRIWKDRGDEFWSSFNQADPAQQAWYYRSVAMFTEELNESLAWKEYSRIVELIFGEKKPVEGRIENGKLVIALSGKIDSANSQEILDQIEKVRAELPADAIILDFDQLLYTTSAGLRIILHIKKAVPDTRIVRAHPDIYSILEMTGFTEMMEIEKAYRVISIRDCEIIGQGANGKVYRIDPDTIVKVYLDSDALPEIHRERELARAAFVAGVPTAIPYDVVRIEGGGFGSVFERLSAKSFAKLLTSGEKTVDELAQMSVDLLNLIHSKTVDPNVMPDMKAVALNWADFLQKYLPQELYEKLHALIDAVPQDLHMVHGDYHLKNVMLQDGETLLIDMDTLCHGHPIFELASMFNAYQGYCAVDHSVVESFLGIPYDTAREFWRKSLSLYLGTTDEARLNEVENKAKVIGFTRIMRRSIRRNGLNTKEGILEIENCKKVLSELLPVTDSLLF